METTMTITESMVAEIAERLVNQMLFMVQLVEVEVELNTEEREYSVEEVWESFTDIATKVYEEGYFDEVEDESMKRTLYKLMFDINCTLACWKTLMTLDGRIPETLDEGLPDFSHAVSFMKAKGIWQKFNTDSIDFSGGHYIQ